MLTDRFLTQGHIAKLVVGLEILSRYILINNEAFCMRIFISEYCKQ